jgi:outer membrane protein OmpA-like peptidoglycan-associated protein
MTFRNIGRARSLLVGMLAIAVGLTSLFACSRQGTNGSGVIAEELERTNRKVEELSRKLEGQLSRIDRQVGELKDQQEQAVETFTSSGSTLTGAEIKDTLVYLEIFFDVNEFGLDADDKETLDKVAWHMSAHPNSILEIYGHTDNSGPTFFNHELSKERANAALRYLVDRYAIPLHRMDALGYGPSKQKYPNPNIEQVSENRNRRIELNLLLLQRSDIPLP